MAVIGYHASHEQFPPSELLECVALAEEAGFAAAMSSDHLAPWGEKQGNSGFAWSWLGAALERTRLTFGVVTSPVGLRYHPLLLAQAGATLAEMYPGRLWIAVGSGEALNERPFGRGWPIKADRNRRLGEAVEIMRALWRGETVTRRGDILLDEARLYSLPREPPALVAAALTPETARWAGGWADALVTINQPRERMAAVVDAFRGGGGEGKPLHLQVHLCFAGTHEEACAKALDQWRTNALPSSVAAELSYPSQFDAATQFLRVEDLHDSVRISADPTEQAEWIAEDIELGFGKIFLHNVGTNQRQFIEAFGRDVLPRLGRPAGPIPGR